MTTNQKMKLNDEVIDGLCSFFKGANTLIEQDSEFATLYAYLLLQATGIERLQKIVYMLDYNTKNSTQVTSNRLKNKLGHKILDIHNKHLYSHFSFNDTENIYIQKMLKILTDLVNENRYTNFDLYSADTFSIHDHIVQILELKDLDYSGIHDVIKVSWEIVDMILKKYISILVNLIWHGNVGNKEVIPICLQDYVLKGWQEINLDQDIKLLLDNARREKR